MILRLTVKRLLSQKKVSTLIITSLAIVFTIFSAVNTGLTEYKLNLHKDDYSSILVAGSTQSHLKTIQNGIYFSSIENSLFPQQELKKMSSYGKVIPIMNMYSANGVGIVGIEQEYFKLKNIQIGKGRFFLRMGECLLGSDAAKKLGLKVGDVLISDSSSSFNVEHSNPVKLLVSGILAKQHAPEDKVIFTDLKTVWTIHGIGHAHDESEENNADKILDLSSENLKNFHFHGDEKNYPLSSALIFPENPQKKAELLALARHNKLSLQIINPAEVIGSVLQSLTGIDRFFYILFSVVAIVILLLISVLIIQNGGLRKEEKIIYRNQGIPGFFYCKLLICEWIIILLLSATFGTCIGKLIQPSISQLVKQLFY